MRAKLLIPALVLLAAPALARTAAAQNVKFEKYTLDNRMQVILHVDHSLPIACINLWYNVGSKDERPGRSGFAHLFEHLMFMGTERVPDSKFDEWMEAGGGSNNASTSEDRTNFFSSGPSNLLPLLLWLDADRLEGLGKAMTQAKLDKQREVVLNERRESYENRPYGKAVLRIDELMYPPDHPYHEITIGSPKDLKAATVEDVKDFFATYYVPNNLSLVVAGDFDPEQIKPLIARWFGTQPIRPEPPRRPVPPVTWKGEKRLTVTDTVPFARTSFVYLTPSYFAKGDAEMDLIASLLAGGKSSRLYKRLVYDLKWAVDVSAWQDSRQFGSQFQINATARRGVALDKIEKVIDEEIEKLIAEGPSKDELERQTASYVFSKINRLQSITSTADQLNLYNRYLGTPDGFKTDLDRYRNATPESVREYAALLRPDRPRLVLRVMPRTEGVTNPRDGRPELGLPKKFEPQLPVEFKLDNGLRVLHWRKTNLPLVKVTMQIGGGATTDTAATAGLASLTASMLDEGAGSLGAIEFADALDRLGASFSPVSGIESFEISLDVLESKFDQAMKLYADAILRPRFDAKEWERVKRLHILGLEHSLDQPDYVARQVAMRELFSDNHPYGRPTSGTIASVKNLQLANVKQKYEQLFFPANATLYVAGDLTTDEAKAALEKAFGQWQNPAGASPVKLRRLPAAAQPMRVFVVDRPDSVQTVIRFEMPGPLYDNDKRTVYNAINTALGGAFSSRLNQNLREQHGYTYGASSSFVMRAQSGYFVALSSVQANDTGASIREFLKELRRARSGDFTKGEAIKAKTTNRQDIVRSLGGLGGIVGTAAFLELNGEEFATIGSDLTKIDKVTSKEMNAVAHDAIPLDHAVLVLVGKKKLILDQLAGIPGLPKPVEVDVYGRPVK